jgi:sigma-70-like protein/putative pyrroloquinoline-quinone binding quinoprotein
MGDHGHSDEALLAAGDGASFARFHDRHADPLLAFLVRRTHDAQLAADLAAEAFAAALIARGRYRRADGAAGAWLRAIAMDRLTDARRTGVVDRSAGRGLGIERIVLGAADVARIEALGSGRPASLWSGRLVAEPAVPVGHARGGDADEDRGPRRLAILTPALPPAGASDYATRLRRQLCDAAPRARRHGRRQRAARAVRGVSVRHVIAAALAGLALAAGAATVWSAAGGRGASTPAPGLHVVRTLAIADGLGRSAQVAFGSVWLSATNDAAVVRVDPRTRRVLARIPVGMDVNIGAGAGAIWAVPRRPSMGATILVRIDPRTNRVVARIQVPSPGGRYPLGGATVQAGRRVWVVGAQGLVAVDPARNRPVREVALGGDFLVVDSLLHGRELWVSRADRSITRFDAVSGQRLGRFGWPAGSGGTLTDGDRIVKVGRRTATAVDPVGGRWLWHTRVGGQLNDAALVGDRLLVEGSNGGGARDTLWELDAHSGDVLSSMTVPGFSVTALLSVGREAWLVTADGHVIVVAP